MNFQKLFKLPRKNENAELYIGNGTIVMPDLCIPLNAISTIRIEKQRMKPLIAEIFIFIIGVFFIRIPIELFQILGTLGIVYGVVIGILTFISNQNRESYLKIRVHSGEIITLQQKDIEFLRRLADVIKEAIDDNAKISYVDMRTMKIKQNIKNMGTMGDVIGGKNSGNTISETSAGGNIVIGDGNETNDRSGNVITGNTVNTTGLSADDWAKLEKYFRTRCVELGKNHPAYKECLRMEQYARAKDAHGLKMHMQAVGKTILSAIISSATKYGMDRLLLTILQKG